MASAAGSAWNVISQRVFSAGMFRGVARHLIPPQGVYTALNGFHDEDGSIYRRGGSEYQSNGGLGAAGLRWLWDGQLVPGARTLVASASKWGVLDADDQTIIDLGAGGLAAPTHASAVGGLLFIGGGAVYGGSRKAADYSTGTVTTTQGSATVTGSGTTWSTNVDAGMLLRVGGASRYYVVASVDSNTQITVSEPIIETGGAGLSYALTRFGVASGHNSSADSHPGAPVAEIYATIADRLVAAAGDTMSWSAERDPANGNFRTHDWNPTDNQKIPGATILALEPLRDTMMVFSTAGVYAATNMAFDLTDVDGNPQQGFERVDSDRILWGKEGVATYANLLVVPCVDGVYSMGVAQGPQLLTRSIRDLYQGYVRAGYKPGKADIYRSHYSLPILDGGNNVVDELCCRLDRPQEVEGLGTVWPWSQIQGHAGNVTALATRVSSGASRAPQLLGASRATGSRILKLGAMWEPAAAVKNDADGSTHAFEVETRDEVTGGEDLNTVLRLRVRYELWDAASDNPFLTAAVAIGPAPAPTGTLWGAFNWGAAPWTQAVEAELEQLPGVAPVNVGRTPKWWRLRRRARYIRVRLRCDKPAAKLVLRSLEWWVRPSGLSR